MKDIWNRIENWLAENYPEGLEKLNPGASEELILQSEQSLGIEFPPDVRDFYKIHNGARGGFALIYGFDLLSMNDIYEHWKVWKELIDEGHFEGVTCIPSEEIKDNWYHEKWIPLTYNGSGDHHCLDLAPTERGTSGQIIEFWHDDPERYLVARSFREFLEYYLEELEAGDYVYSDDYEGIVSVDDI